ncbi:MAG: CapA family protein [Deltaproteobacteria bacterium]|nr:CapA family protein [Deltaproteobacteria bacterium]
MAHRPVFAGLLLLIASIGAGTGCSQAPRDGAPAPKTDAPPEQDRAATTPTVAVPNAPASASAPARPLRVIVGGDLLPHRPSLVTPAAIQGALAPLGPLFGQADGVIANYEAATGDVDAKTQRLAYAAPKGWLASLPRTGIKAVTVANNHSCDLGEPGLVATLDEAKQSGLVAIGGDDVDPWTPRVVATDEASGKRVCAIGWTTLSNSEGACSKGKHLAFAPLNGSGKGRIDCAFAKARAAKCDATIAIMHGGIEYVPQTTQVMDQAAHAAEAGADAVVVHHPHIASPVTVHGTKDGRNVPIFASIGNLVTNQGESWKPPMFPVLQENRRLVCVNGWTRLGVLADFTFAFDEKSGDGRHADPPTAGRVMTHAKLDWGMHLLWITNEHAEDRSIAVPKIEARLLDPEKDKAVIAKLQEDERGPVALFSDPCWFERPGAASDRDPRCTSTPPPGSVVAKRPAREHKKTGKIRAAK